MSRRSTRRARARKWSFNTCELLENRRLLCALAHEHLIDPPVWSDAIEQDFAAQSEGGPDAVSLFWVNRGQASDGFAAAFGTSAAAARNVVDAALFHWQRAFTSFNRSDGTSTLQINISMARDNNGNLIGGFGGAGAPANTAPSDGKPRTGSFTLNAGSITADPNDSNGWYLDPNPQDWAEFTNVTNGYTGTAPVGSDLYSVACAEVMHVLGLITDKNNDGTSWNGYRLETSGMLTNTGIRDNAEGGGNFGHYWVFDGPSVDHLMTSYNSGDATSASWGNAIHSAGGGGNIDFAARNWRGAEDPGNAAGGGNERTIPSWTMTYVLADAYGYSAVDPTQFGSFYASLNRTTGELTVRGGAGASADLIHFSESGGMLQISVDVGDDVPGTGSGSGAGNQAPYISRYFINEVNSITVDAGGGADIVRFENNLGKPTTVNGGDGDDVVDLGWVSGNLDLVGNVTFNGGSGFDRAFLYDDFDTTADTFTITSTTLDSTGASGVLTYSLIEELNPRTGTGADTINISSSPAATKIHLASVGGLDVLNIGGVAGAGAQQVLGQVHVENNPSFTTININDGANPSARTVAIDQWSGNLGAIGGLTPDYITWDRADVTYVNILTGAGQDVVNLLRTSEFVTLDNTAGRNAVTVGNDTNGMQSITGDVYIDSPFVHFTDLVFNNAADTTGRGASWAASGPDFVITGLAPATLRYRYQAVLNFDVLGGSGNDAFTIAGIQDNIAITRVDGGGGVDTFTLDDRPLAAAITEMDFHQVSGEPGHHVFLRMGFPTQLVTTIKNIEAPTYLAQNSTTQIEVSSVPASIPAGQQMSIFTGSGSDTLTVFPVDAAGNMTINGTLFVNAGSGAADALVVTGEGATPVSYVLSHLSGPGIQHVSGLGGGLFGETGFDSITINAGNGNDTFQVEQLMGGAAVRLNGGGGEDDCTIGHGDMAANLTNASAFTFDGQADDDRFTINNTLASVTWNYTVQDGAVTTSRPSTGYTWHSVLPSVERQYFFGGSGTDAFFLDEVAPGAYVECNGMGGGDSMLFGVSTSLDSVRGPVVFNGGAGGGILRVLDQADTTGDVVHLTAATLGAFAGDTLFGPGGSLTFSEVVNSGATPGIELNLGSGADTVYAQPLAGARVTIAANNPTAAPGDTLSLALAGVQSPSVVHGASGSVSSSNRQTLTWTGIDQASQPIDDVAPAMVGADINVDGFAGPGEGAQRRQSLDVRFSENVSGLISPSWLTLENTTTGATIPTANVAVTYDVPTNTARFTFPGYADGVLPDGNYTGRVRAGLPDPFGNGLPADATFGFFFLQADANHDRRVNLADFNVLAANFGGSDKLFSQGDFNYDGLVNLSDFNILAARFGNTLGAADAGIDRAPFSAVPITAAGKSPRSRRLLGMLNDLLA